MEEDKNEGVNVISLEDFKSSRKGRVARNLSENGRALLVERCKDWLENCIRLSEEDSNFIVSEFTTNCKPKNWERNFRMSLAGVITKEFGFDKVKAGKEMHPNIERVLYADGFIKLDLQGAKVQEEDKPIEEPEVIIDEGNEIISEEPEEVTPVTEELEEPEE